jgi:23S rRNA (cytosine1962-C5)-methyltransferase
MTLLTLLEEAMVVRRGLLDDLGETTCYRVLHGVTEGRPGLAVDRYGSVLLAQTWKDPLSEGDQQDLARFAADQGLTPVWNHRRGGGSTGPVPEEVVGTELGLRFDVRPRHRGQDPLLFLDFRAARRWVRAHADGRSVLNLFAYTCGIGVAAAAGGARRVLNVDFATSALAVGRRNATLNGVTMETFASDVFPAIRQLAGLPVGGRRGRRPRFRRLDQEAFDLVVLDPPRWAKSAWGAVDIVRDYPSLFKPALLATATGGTVLATNHEPRVALDDWLAVLRRTAEKVGRPVRGIEVLPPEADFPSFDGAHPLKVAIVALD